MNATIDINDAQAFFTNLEKHLKDELRYAERRNLVDGVKLAKNLSSGEYTTQDLIRLRHPYKHGGQPPQDPAIANEQSGRMKASWKNSLGVWTGDELCSTIYNDAPEAKYFDDDQYPEGTDRMMARPLKTELVKQLEPIRNARIQKVLDTL